MKHFRPDYQDRIVDLEGKIPDHEPVVLFRAQDECAIHAIDAYIEALQGTPGVHPAFVARFRQIAKEFADWPNKKVPDSPDEPNVEED